MDGILSLPRARCRFVFPAPFVWLLRCGFISSFSYSFAFINTGKSNDFFQFNSKAVAAQAVPGSASLPGKWEPWEQGRCCGIPWEWGKRVVGGIKIRSFHSQAPGQRLIHGIEGVIPKSGMLFREKGFIYGKACAERREVGAVLCFSLWNLELAPGRGMREDTVDRGWLCLLPGLHKSWRNSLGNAGA